MIKNEGKYDAYIDATSYSYPSVDCTPGVETSASLVEKACDEMDFLPIVWVVNDSGELENVPVDENGFVFVPMNSSVLLEVEVGTSSEAMADGPFSVKWEPFSFKFTTTNVRG